jgi:hypothetical protein
MTRRHENGEREIGNGNCMALCVSTEQNDKFDKSEIAELIGFFRLLDKWDREATRNAEIM